MKLLCISAAAEEKEDVRQQQLNGNHQQESSQQQQPTKLRSWYNSLRKGLKGKSREPRVTISDPITSVQLTQSELIQINGVIEVKPSDRKVSANGDADDHQKEITSTTAATVDSATANGEGESGDNRDAVDGSSSRSPPSNSAADPEVDEEENEKRNEEEDDEEEEDTSQRLVSYSWFWGGISRREAETLLRGRKDGTFLVRDSSERPRYLYSLSFRSNGKTMHTRIEQLDGRLYFSSSTPHPSSETFHGSGIRREDGSRSLGGLIAAAMNQSNGPDSIFFYSRAGLRIKDSGNNNGEDAPPAASTASLHTVQLNTPLSRFEYLLDFQYNGEVEQKKTLQYLCKFVLHHVPEAKAMIDEASGGEGQLATLPLELQRFATSTEYFPRPVKVA